MHLTFNQKKNRTSFCKHCPSRTSHEND